MAALPGGRRVSGLRREEVAQLAGVSVDYYIRLERGRNANVSAAVLTAVARALQLDETERRHLFALAGPTRQRAGGQPDQQTPRPGLLRVLDSITDIPALLLGHRLDVLALNHLARALYPELAAMPAGERNMARYAFLTDAARSLYVDWPDTARESVGMLRLYASHHPDDPRLAELVDELSSADPDFRRWWVNHEVYLPQHGTKPYHHPLVGPLTLAFEAFTPMGDPDQTLGLYTVEPGSKSEDALRLLAGRVEPQPTNSNRSTKPYQAASPIMAEGVRQTHR
ncbi:transcriptional regulator [Catellatospora citrea]|uniref:Transcriptional regulator n=1 Tax=Catellatospora citrea TaxID=53366 RepID=A0A8J3KPM6_9ACTN|nr:transcriptional regulator [Catellatospora citrea]